MATALAALQPVLDQVAAGTLPGAEIDARQIELTCHQALARAGDPRADEWLVRAHTADETAATVSDAALREGVLQANPHHRGILEAWAMRDDPMPALDRG